MAEALKLFTAAVGTVPPTESNPAGLACELGAFTDALWRAGYRPEQVGGRWQIAFPTRPTGGADWDRQWRQSHNLARPLTENRR